MTSKIELIENQFQAIVWRSRSAPILEIIKYIISYLKLFDIKSNILLKILESLYLIGIKI